MNAIKASLANEQSRLDVRKCSFSQRTIIAWNKLSTDTPTVCTLVVLINYVQEQKRQISCKAELSIWAHCTISFSLPVLLCPSALKPTMFMSIHILSLHLVLGCPLLDPGSPLKVCYTSDLWSVCRPST